MQLLKELIARQQESSTAAELPAPALEDMQNVSEALRAKQYVRELDKFGFNAFVIKLTMLPSPAALPLPQSLRRTEFWQHTEHFGLEELCMGIFTRVTSMCRRRKVLFYDFGLCKCNATEEEIQRDMHAVHELLSQGH